MKSKDQEDNLEMDQTYEKEKHTKKPNENSKKESLCVKNFSLIPEAFKHLIVDLNEVEPNEYLSYCDCCGTKATIDKCPHWQNVSLRKMLQLLPLKIQHIIKSPIEAVTKVDIKKELFLTIMNELLLHYKLCQCKIKTTQIPLPGQKKDDIPAGSFNHEITGTECHVYLYLQQQLPDEYEEYFQDQAKQKAKRKVTVQSVMVNISIAANALLLLTNVITLIFSKSMTIAAAVMDSVMDILCGIGIYVAMKLAKSGIKRGQYQRAIHSNDQTAKYVYAHRYEQIGVLTFSWIMATLACTLAKEDISTIVDYAQGGEVYVEFGVLPMTLLGFAIGLKLILVIAIQIMISKYGPKQEQYDVLITYRHDHVNDFCTNTVGFIATIVCVYAGNDWKYIDPCSSFCVAMYILYSWIGNALEQMRSLAGHTCEQDELDQYMVRIMHQFISSVEIKEVCGMVGYQSASQAVLEVRLLVEDYMTVANSHDICQEIISGMERVEGVERCHVHIETKECDNVF